MIEIELPSISELRKNPAQMRTMCATFCGYFVVQGKDCFELLNRNGFVDGRTGAYTTLSEAWNAVPRYHESRDAMAEVTDGLSDYAHLQFRGVLHRIIDKRHAGETSMTICRAHYSVVPIDILAALLISQGLARE